MMKFIPKLVCVLSLFLMGASTANASIGNIEVRDIEYKYDSNGQPYVNVTLYNKGEIAEDVTVDVTLSEHYSRAQDSHLARKVGSATGLVIVQPENEIEVPMKATGMIRPGSGEALVELSYSDKDKSLFELWVDEEGYNKAIETMKISGIEIPKDKEPPIFLYIILGAIILYSLVAARVWSDCSTS